MTSRLPFAPFVVDGSHTMYGTTIELDERVVPVTVPTALAPEPSAAEALANDVVLWVAGEMASILVFCADRLLADYNEGWVDEGEERLDQSQFMARLGVRAIAAQADRSLLVTMYDRGLFRGHDVVVTVGPDRRLLDVELVG